MALRFLVFLTLAIRFTYGDEEPMTLTPENFDQAIQTNKKILVEFYAPWCGHCQEFEPKYKQIAKKVSEDSKLDVVVAKIDGDAHTDISDRLKIEGFPTILLFKGNDKGEMYNGELEVDDVLKFLKTGINPDPQNYGNQQHQDDGHHDPQEQHEEHEGHEQHEEGDPAWKSEQIIEINITNLTTVDEIKAYTKKATDSTPVSIAFISEANVAGYLEAAYYSPSMHYAQVLDTSVAKEYGAEFGTIHLFKVTDDEPEEPAIYKGDLSEKAIRTWVSKNRFPVVGQMTEENMYDYWGEDEGQQLAYLVVSGKDDEAKKKAIGILKKYGAKLPNLRCLWIDRDAQLYTQLKDELAMGSSELLLTEGFADQFLYEGSLDDSAKLDKFFKDFEEKKLKTRTQSEEIPETNDEPVKVLVAKNIHETIGNDQDVLIDFYAPWCQHCKELEPKYKKVGDVFEPVEDLVIAKMDATKNEVPHEVESYPTLLFYPKGKTEALKYKGELETKDIVNWLKEQASVDISQMKEEL